MPKKKQKDYAKSTHKMVKIGFVAGSVMLGLGVVGGVAGLIGRNMIQQKRAEVYSVSFDLDGDMTQVKRGDAAVGMKAGINGAQNDFDKAYPWADIKQVTDVNGDVFTRIPKFYEKYEVNGTVVTYSITSEPRKGFTPNIAFKQGDKEIPYIDIGSYEASIDAKGKLRSVSGVMPEVTGHTLDEYRTLAEANGNQLFDARGNQALQSLFLVEFATFDSQSIMTGNTQYGGFTHSFTEEEIEAGVIQEFDIDADELMVIDYENTSPFDFAKANLDQLTLDNGNDEYVHVAATNIVLDDITITLTLAEEFDISGLIENEQDSIYLMFGGDYMKTGITDGKAGSSVGYSLASLKNGAMKYRGVENWYGNTWTWCDGLATYQDSEEGTKYLCVSMDATKNGDRDSYTRFEFEDDDETIMTSIGFNLFKFQGGTEYENDNFYLGSADDVYRIGWVGGGSGVGLDAGAFFVLLYYAVSLAYDSARLSCIPQAL